MSSVTNCEPAKDAAKRVEAILALPDLPSEELYPSDEYFEPWALFPSVYGSYSGRFDDLAIAVLEDILHNTHICDGLANEIFREMLCTSDLCDYGTSPRTCFATPEFKLLLPELITKWKKYADIKWGG